MLDYSCGHGLLIPHLLRCGCRVTAADIDTAVIGEAANKLVGTAGFLGLFSFQELLERGEKYDLGEQHAVEQWPSWTALASTPLGVVSALTFNPGGRKLTMTHSR